MLETVFFRGSWFDNCDVLPLSPATVFPVRPRPPLLPLLPLPLLQRRCASCRWTARDALPTLSTTSRRTLPTTRA